MQRTPMSFFKSDLSRNFAIGFAAGALVIALQISPELVGQIVTDTVAAIAP